MSLSPSGITRADQSDSGETDKPKRGRKMSHKITVLMHTVSQFEAGELLFLNNFPPATSDEIAMVPGGGRDGLELPLRNA